MAKRSGRHPFLVFSGLPPYRPRQSLCTACLLHRGRLPSTRKFSASASRTKGGIHGDQGPFTSRLRKALSNTKVQWKPIPVGIGIGFLGFLQFYRIQRREKQRQEDELYDESGNGGNGQEGKPKKRKRIRPSGPWYVRP